MEAQIIFGSREQVGDAVLREVIGGEAGVPSERQGRHGDAFRELPVAVACKEIGRCTAARAAE